MSFLDNKNQSGGKKNVFARITAVIASSAFIAVAVGASAVVAAVTIGGASITGTASTTMDVGAGNTLLLQTTNNGPVTFGTGAVTLPGVTSSLVYATSSGQLVPLALGTGLSISGGILNASSGGPGGSVSASGTLTSGRILIGAGSSIVQAAASGNTSSNTPSSTYQTWADCRNDVLSYTAFQAAATASSVPLFTAPAYWKAVNFTLEETQTFTSGAGTVTNLAATITGTGGTAFTTPFLLMGSTTPPFADFDGGDFSTAANASATQTVAVQIAVTNLNPGNLSNLTAGQLTIRSCGQVLQ